MTPATHKLWNKRRISYEAGAPVPKSIINRLCALQRCYAAPFSTSSLAWSITPEQTAQGLEWLNRRAICASLPPRALTILGDFSHFLFVGIQHFGRCATPVYRVCAANSPAFFNYTASPGCKAATILHISSPNVAASCLPK